MNGQNPASNVSRGTNPGLPHETTFREAPETPAPAEKKNRQNRDCHLKIRLTPKELAHLKRKAQEAGTDCSKYVRAKLDATDVKATPRIDWADWRRQVNSAGSRINDVLARARSVGFIDVPELQKALDALSAANTKYTKMLIAFENGRDPNG